MKFHISIPRYRIVPAPFTGIGWVAVERWRSRWMTYTQVATFRTQELAQEFIDDELRDEEELATTKVCDSCGLRFPAEELAEVEDFDGETCETYQICKTCRGEN